MVKLPSVAKVASSLIRTFSTCPGLKISVIPCHIHVTCIRLLTALAGYGHGNYSSKASQVYGDGET